MTWSYRLGGTPGEYVCHECGARGCKLWRPPQCEKPLRCARCVAKRGGERIEFDARGLHVSEWGESDQTLHCLPAVPVDGEPGEWWGYSSVPQTGVAWWRALPTYADRCEVTR